MSRLPTIQEQVVATYSADKDESLSSVILTKQEVVCSSHTRRVLLACENLVAALQPDTVIDSMISKITGDKSMLYAFGLLEETHCRVTDFSASNRNKFITAGNTLVFLTQTLQLLRTIVQDQTATDETRAVLKHWYGPKDEYVRAVDAFKLAIPKDDTILPDRCRAVIQCVLEDGSFKDVASKIQGCSTKQCKRIFFHHMNWLLKWRSDDGLFTASVLQCILSANPLFVDQLNYVVTVNKAFIWKAIANEFSKTPTVRVRAPHPQCKIHETSEMITMHGMMKLATLLTGGVLSSVQQLC